MRNGLEGITGAGSTVGNGIDLGIKKSWKHKRKLEEELRFDEMYDLNMTPFRKAVYTVGHKVKNALYKAGRFAKNGGIIAAAALGPLVGSAIVTSCASPLKVPDPKPSFSTEITNDSVNENTEYIRQIAVTGANNVSVKSPSYFSASIANNVLTVKGPAPNVTEDTPVPVDLLIEGDGGSAEKAWTLMIKNVNNPPTPTITGPSSIKVGVPAIYTAKLPDPNSGEGDYVRRADIRSDGKVLDTLTFTSATDSADFKVTFDTAGTKNLEVVAYDTFNDAGTSNMVTTDVTASDNPAPTDVTLSGVPTSIQKGFSADMDIGWKDDVGDYAARWELANAGNNDQILKSGTLESLTDPIKFSYTFNDVGTINVKAIIYDTHGNVAYSQTHSVNVTNPDPGNTQPVITDYEITPTEGDEGTGFTGHATVEDADGDTITPSFNYAWASFNNPVRLIQQKILI